MDQCARGWVCGSYKFWLRQTGRSVSLNLAMEGGGTHLCGLVKKNLEKKDGEIRILNNGDESPESMIGFGRDKIGLGCGLLERGRHKGGKETNGPVCQ